MHIKFHTEAVDFNADENGLAFNLHGPGGEFNVDFAWEEASLAMVKLAAMAEEMDRVVNSEDIEAAVNQFRSEQRNVEARLRSGLLLTANLPPKVEKMMGKN